MSRISIGILASLFAWTAVATTRGDDWTRFRGPNGSGISAESTAVPTEWSDTKNLQWKCELPGPGASSPIVVGDKVFVTCWTGYGLDRRDPGEIDNLTRHLVCIDRSSGAILWQSKVKAKLPEEPFQDMFAEHGYATHTPVSDGRRVFAFFGKSGVYAYDMDGKELWNADVGSDLDRRRWGSASSPILCKNLLIVPAVVESHSLIALNVDNGQVVWKKEADGFGNCWGTPILVDLPDGGQEIVFCVPGEIWAFDPENEGKLKWHAPGPPSDSMCSSAFAHDGIVYAFENGPRGGGTVAVKAGGSDDVAKTHVLWTGRSNNRIATPIFHDGKIFWFSNKMVGCVNATDGQEISRQRLDGSSATADAAPGGGGRQGPPGGGRGLGGRGRGPGGQDYSSAVFANGHAYYPTRDGTVHVLELGESIKPISQNKLSESGQIVSTPAVSNGQLFLRSEKYLYCIGESR